MDALRDNDGSEALNEANLAGLELFKITESPSSGRLVRKDLGFYSHPIFK